MTSRYHTIAQMVFGADDVPSVYKGRSAGARRASAAAFPMAARGRTLSLPRTSSGPSWTITRCRRSVSKQTGWRPKKYATLSAGNATAIAARTRTGPFCAARRWQLCPPRSTTAAVVTRGGVCSRVATRPPRQNVSASTLPSTPKSRGLTPTTTVRPRTSGS